MDWKSLAYIVCMDPRLTLTKLQNRGSLQRNGNMFSMAWCAFEAYASNNYRTQSHESRTLVCYGAFLLESVVRYAALVHCLEFRGCPLFGSSKCIASTRIVVGRSTEVCYTEDVRYLEGLLSEVPLYTDHKISMM